MLLFGEEWARTMARIMAGRGQSEQELVSYLRETGNAACEDAALAAFRAAARMDDSVSTRERRRR